MNIRLRPTKQLMFVLENVAMTWVMFSLTLFMFLGCHFHFLWECSSQYFGVLLPFFMEVFIITFFLCSLKGISPMDRERNLFPAVSPVQPPNGRLATSWDVTFIFYESVHHYISFGRLAACDPPQTLLFKHSVAIVGFGYMSWRGDGKGWLWFVFC